MKKKRLSLITVAGITLLFASAGFANVPPPPVNQTIGMADTEFGNQNQTTCRACHDITPPENVDRHHVLMNTVIPDPTVAPNGTPGENYGCLSCHNTNLDPIEFIVERDCLQCHTSSPHHETAAAVGGDCKSCHGDLVDNMGDGHVIPTYTPSLVTPSPSDGTGPGGAGACDYCHDEGTDTDSGIVVSDNEDNHHGTGLNTGPNCVWCHKGGNPGSNDADIIRTCEGCHGFESLHNIAIDSDGGGLVVGGELPGYSHVGSDDDCWGCHGFTAASAPGTGPITPYISSTDASVVTTGSDTMITLTGAAFTNIVYGFEWSSHVRLTADDNSSVNLTPDAITQGTLTVTIPGTTVPGNYTLQVVKDTQQTVDAASNPVVLTVKPEVVITDVVCFRFLGIMFIAGSGFGEKPVGTDDYINAVEGDRSLNVIFWRDNAIWAFGSSCSGTVTVNALFGSAIY